MLKKIFRNKIAIKLSTYFAIALLLFSIIIGTVFIVLFKNYTVKNHKEELKKRASSIASNLSTFMSAKNTMGGYGAYLKFIGDIAGTDIWIIDENLKLLTSGMGHGRMGQYNIQYSELPKNADELIKQVFNGDTFYSEDFSGILTEPTLTVCTPIINESAKIIGAVLLHSPIDGVSDSIAQGIKVLLTSIFVAIIIVFVLAIRFSLYFTKPLNKMKDIAIQLSKGDFSVKTNIIQNDEIGELAVIMDSLAIKLKKSSDESAQLEQMRKDFVANISHELRTPVTVIRGSLEALIDDVVTGENEVKGYHVQMLSETIFLQRLIGDLLDLSRLQNIHFAINKQDVLIGDVILDVIRSAKTIADKKNIIINMENNSENILIKGDYQRLRQMFMIVIDNAIKFSNEQTSVDIVLNNNKILIKDYGIGIPSSDIEHIFTRFYKLRSEQNKLGTGLGLTIAKEIANRHDINLFVTSENNNGSTFIFELNLGKC